MTYLRHPPITRWRQDGWPLCPYCGDDEAYSLESPVDREHLDGCYVCGRFPLSSEREDAVIAANDDTETTGPGAIWPYSYAQPAVPPDHEYQRAVIGSPVPPERGQASDLRLVELRAAGDPRVLELDRKIAKINDEIREALRSGSQLRIVVPRPRTVTAPEADEHHDFAAEFSRGTTRR